MTATFEIRDRLFFERASAGAVAFRLTCDPIKLPLRLEANCLPILGVTGLGKSTFLNLLAGFEFPSAGQIHWSFDAVPGLEPNFPRTAQWGKDGPDPVTWNFLRKTVFGFACQNSPLLPYLTVADNLAYPLQLRGLDRAATEHRVSARLPDWLVDGENPTVMLAKYPMELSGGQRQRIALLKAVIHDPVVLIADEPTGSLDAKTREQIMTTIVAWVKAAPGRLFLWVTHYDDDPIRYSQGAYLRVDMAGIHWCPAP